MGIRSLFVHFSIITHFSTVFSCCWNGTKLNLKLFQIFRTRYRWSMAMIMARSGQGRRGYPGYPQAGLGYPPPPHRLRQQSEHFIHGGWYVSCVHAGGLSCFSVRLDLCLTEWGDLPWLYEPCADWFYPNISPQKEIWQHYLGGRMKNAGNKWRWRTLRRWR